jgi:hypothetical protein
MSYILDALRKASEKRASRQREDGPLYLQNRQPDKKGFKMMIVAVLVLCTVAAMGLVFIGGRYFTFSPPVPEPAPSQGITTETDKSGAISNRTSEPEPNTVISEAAKPASSPGSTDQADTPQLSNPSKTIPSGALPELKELPLFEKSVMPEMKFSGHVYSQNPRLRMIMINSAIVREKEMVGPELQLIEITETGLIMRFKDTRFKVTLLDSPAGQ